MPEVFEELRRLWNATQGGGGLIAGLLVAILLLIVVGTSWFTVQPEETAIVLRFGKVVRTAGPGLHFKWPYGAEAVIMVPTARVLKEEFGFRTVGADRQTQYATAALKDESLMLTGDLNVIDVGWIVQYRIADPIRFLFRVREAQQTIRDVSEAVMRRVVGNRIGSDVLTVGRVQISREVKDEMQKILDSYDSGVSLVTVELQDVTPPDPVKPAFNEVNEARQDRERTINQAQEQANREIPKAGGEAARTVTEAEGYALERVNRARGESDRFVSVLAEYERAPDVTRKRLYLEALKTMLPAAKSIYVVDEDQKAMVPLLPLDAAPKSAAGGKP
ncbi:MAG: FtsH protease activity modulator HflK [Candidatus Binatia bacterium]